MLRVGYLSSHNYLSRRSFSGTLFSMREALRRQDIETIDLGWPARPGLAERYRRRFLKCKPVNHGDRLHANLFALLVKAQLRLHPCDVLFAPVAATCMSALKTTVPIVYSSDTTFSLHRRHYKLKHPAAILDTIEENERAAIARATRLLYSSRWAANSAIEEYGASSSAVDIAAYGANFSQPPGPELTAERLSALGDGPCRLLFVGVDYERKGGAIAIEALRVLRSRGLDAQLTMVGTGPPDGRTREGLNVVSFINKDIPDQARRLDQLFLDSHFMIFPTRADCSPIVLCEAAAYGLPVISSNVGGIADIVQDGVSGVLLDATAQSHEYADQIATVWSDRDRYRSMVERSRAGYEQRLNWDAWGRVAVESLRRAAVATTEVRIDDATESSGIS